MTSRCSFFEAPRAARVPPSVLASVRIGAVSQQESNDLELAPRCGRAQGKALGVGCALGVSIRSRFEQQTSNFHICPSCVEWGRSIRGAPIRVGTGGEQERHNRAPSLRRDGATCCTGVERCRFGAIGVRVCARVQKQSHDARLTSGCCGREGDTPIRFRPGFGPGFRPAPGLRPPCRTRSGSSVPLIDASKCRIGRSC
jgi:hypothetical protein